MKIIGLTLETRPDTIDATELRRLRSYGCTRVQLGLQHTDDNVLKKINRGCTTAHAATALRRLKDACYKVPGARPRASAGAPRRTRSSHTAPDGNADPDRYRSTRTSCPTSPARRSRWTARCSSGCYSTRTCRPTSGRSTRRRRDPPRSTRDPPRSTRDPPRSTRDAPAAQRSASTASERSRRAVC